jgi:hypothetical protein
MCAPVGVLLSEESVEVVLRATLHDHRHQLLLCQEIHPWKIRTTHKGVVDRLAERNQARASAAFSQTKAFRYAADACNSLLFLDLAPPFALSAPNPFSAQYASAL